MTSPAPNLNDLTSIVRDLSRRIRDLETGRAAAPAATAVAAAAAPYSAGDTSRWADTAATSWATLYAWWARMEWTKLDALINGSATGGASWQVRLTCAGTVLWTSPAQPTAGQVAWTVDLTTALATLGGTLARFTLDGQVVGGSGGSMFALPERLLFQQPVFA